MVAARRKMLVTGREGQVVHSLIERSAGSEFDIVTIGRPDLDLSQPEGIAVALEALRPDIIVSAAAYTAVDQAETDEQAAMTVNGTAAGEIAKAASKLAVPLIHISTDYVFDGAKSSAYVETDPVAPIGAYGRSKLAGEMAVAAETSDFAILRTAWVYSPFGRNFLKTMLRLAEGRDRISVVNDQIGNPTSALDIADGILAVGRNLLADPDPALRGVFHMTAAGEASWADFAAEIFACSRAAGGAFAAVDPIPSSQYPTPAKRPANSRLDCRKLEQAHGVHLPEWRQSTAAIVTRCGQ
ncbi:MAG: dTDP-4-dehydrorhamnose reductase [Rhizobiaceae bacterium]|nr:dTDP-4-dehydrorhamnose reductase [Rhizobiaceae bacterium]